MIIYYTAEKINTKKHINIYIYAFAYIGQAADSVERARELFFNCVNFYYMCERMRVFAWMKSVRMSI